MKPKGGGDCYVAAYRLVMDSGALPLVLCHGIVTGVGESVKGWRFGHAWAETPDGALVFDFSNGKENILRREDYYRIGKIDAGEVVRYDKGNAQDTAARAGTYGPWTPTPEPYRVRP